MPNNPSQQFLIKIILTILIILILGVGLLYAGYKIFQVIVFQPIVGEKTYNIQDQDLFEKIGTTQDLIYLVPTNANLGKNDPFAPK